MSAEEITLRVARPEDAKALLAIYAAFCAVQFTL